MPDPGLSAPRPGCFRFVTSPQQAEGIDRSGNGRWCNLCSILVHWPWLAGAARAVLIPRFFPRFTGAAAPPDLRHDAHLALDPDNSCSDNKLWCDSAAPAARAVGRGVTDYLVTAVTHRQAGRHATGVHPPSGLCLGAGRLSGSTPTGAAPAGGRSRLNWTFSGRRNWSKVRRAGADAVIVRWFSVGQDPLGQ